MHCNYRANMFQEDTPSPVPSSSPLHLFSLMSLSPSLGSPYTWLRDLKSEDRGLCLIKLLVECASHVSAKKHENANFVLELISHLASPDGDSMQRIAAYFTESLADRMIRSSLPGVHKALNSTKKLSVSEEIMVKKLFFELCPFMKLAYVITNQSIIEAMEGERMVHIIDFNSFEPAQWIDLLQMFRARPEGPPHLRITAIHEKKEVLELMANLLNKEAERMDIPFQFNPIVTKLENLDFDCLRVKTGEALAISSVLKLHELLAFDDDISRRMSSPSTPLFNNFHTLGDFLVKDVDNFHSPGSDSSSSSSSPLSFTSSPNISNFLSAIRCLSPKVMVVTEQESNHNLYSLIDRVTQALNYYGALFDCLESTVSRLPIERQKLEKMLFGEEIKNIVACEGFERSERHEKLERWVTRLELAGFRAIDFSYYNMMQAKRFLNSSWYDGYSINQERGGLAVYWKKIPLFSISSWRFAR